MILQVFSKRRKNEVHKNNIFEQNAMTTDTALWLENINWAYMRHIENILCVPVHSMHAQVMPCTQQKESNLSVAVFVYRPLVLSISPSKKQCLRLMQECHPLNNILVINHNSIYIVNPPTHQAKCKM